MAGYIEREVRRRVYVVSRWKRREQERLQKEAENKHLAGISAVAELSATEKLQKMRVWRCFLIEGLIILKTGNKCVQGNPGSLSFPEKGALQVTKVAFLARRLSCIGLPYCNRMCHHPASL